MALGAVSSFVPVECGGDYVRARPADADAALRQIERQTEMGWKRYELFLGALPDA